MAYKKPGKHKTVAACDIKSNEEVMKSISNLST